MDGPSRECSAEALKANAFGAVFGAGGTITKVRCWLARLGVSPADQGDVTQDVFVRALGDWVTYDPRRSPPLRWLNMVTVSVAAAHRRRLRRLNQGEAFELLDLIDPGPSGHEYLEVVDWLGALDPVALTMVNAYDLDGIPMKVVAKELKMALSTAYKLHARVVGALKSAMAGMGRPRKSGHGPR